jgi:hypothetical protein
LKQRNATGTSKLDYETVEENLEWEAEGNKTEAKNGTDETIGTEGNIGNGSDVSDLKILVDFFKLNLWFLVK